MTDVQADLATAARLLEGIGAGVRADARGDDPGTLHAIGRLHARLDAARALAASDRDGAAVFARGLLHAIAAAFPARVDWTATRSDETLHHRHEAIGRAILVEGEAV